MKKLNFQEFQKRLNETAKARKIFIPYITKNITTAFELYQEVLADEEMEVIITNAQTPSGNIERPRCDECDGELRLYNKPQKIDGEFYPTTWKCDCGMEYHTKKTAEEWYKELRIED